MKPNIINEIKTLEVKIGKRLFQEAKLQEIKRPPSPLQAKILKYILDHKEEVVCGKDLENYLHQYKENKSIIIVKNDYNQLIYLDKNHILKFFSNAKQNYCETIDNKKYIINKKLYEIEKLDSNYIRISKHCIVNLKNIKYFDMNSTRKNNS